MPPPLLVELQQRRVFRVLIGYGIASFAVLQVIEPLMHALHLPDSTLTYLVVALAAGFPLLDGTISVQSEPDRGSTFTVELPLSGPRVSVDPPDTAEPAPPE